MRITPLKKIRLLSFGVASRDVQRFSILMVFGISLGMIDFNVITLLLFIFSLCSLISTDIFANIINDIYDIEVDAEMKPFRPLPSGEVKIEEGIKGSIIFAFVAVVSAIVTYVLSFNLLLLAILLFALLLSYVYSAPPIRLKSRSWFGPITLSAVYYASVVSGFLIGGAEMSRISILCIIFLTVFLASSVKDFEDYTGDKKFGIHTPVVVYGIKKTATIIIYLTGLTLSFNILLILYFFLKGLLFESLFLAFILIPLSIFLKSVITYQRRMSTGALRNIIKVCFYWMYLFICLTGITIFGYSYLAKFF